MNRTARVAAAALICGGAAVYVSAPLDAHHRIDFASHSCADVQASPSPSPSGQPEPTPTPEGEQPPPPPQSPPPPQNCMPDEGERIWGTRVIRFSTSTDGSRPFKRVALFILSEEEGIPHPKKGDPLVQDTYSRSEDVRSYEWPFTWNSVEATPYNGRYKIRVEADTHSSLTTSEHQASSERKRLLVDNAPEAVSAPDVVAATISSVTIQWEDATEPDVSSYTVYRAKTAKADQKPSYNAFEQVGITTGNAYREKLPPGVYWYSVRVTRRSIVTPEEGISSGLSVMSGAAEVKSAIPPKKDNDDDDGGGGNAPEPPAPLRTLTAPPVASRLANAPDAPFAYKLPYDKDVGSLAAPREGSSEEGGSTDPRGPVLPVAVGMFLLSSALAVGRMPY